jgi:chromosome segregation ATPase
MNESVVTASEVRDIVVGAIEALVLPRFDEHDKRFETLEKDMSEVKEDVRVLKEDVGVLKEDVKVLKADVGALKKDMREVKAQLDDIDGRLKAVEADIKELYGMMSDMQKQTGEQKQFAQQSIEQQILQTYDNLRLIARQAGVTLPE